MGRPCWLWLPHTKLSYVLENIETLELQLLCQNNDWKAKAW